jgi:hypothetical protein
MKEKYIPGEGCECSARCSCECGCDVDWTPREVYELRDKAERYRLDANAMMMQRDRLAEAATVLIAAKGRHNTMLAYQGLREALASVEGGNHDN